MSARPVSVMRNGITLTHKDENSMIILQLNKRDFEYDTHSLVKAFYPSEDVAILYEGDEISGEFSLKISIFYRENEIEICLEEKGGHVVKKETEAVAYEADRKETKNRLKYRLYLMLSGYTGIILPWGTLTGIRPTKIPMALLDEGMSNREIADYMRKTYLISPEKTALGISIANRERHILRDIDYVDGYSLYVGIPFCPSICLYCSFSSSPLSVWRDRVDDYLDALVKEIAFGADAYKDKTLDTVYIGGGTPTTLEPYQLERLLTEIETRFDLSKIKEFTVEAGRPDSITREKLEVLRRHPVTRISINPQTMNQETLDIIGRRHTVGQTKEAFLLARELSFDNINMDLIVGLPGEEKEAVEHTLREVLALDPDSVTVHSLAVKRAARLCMFKDQYKELTFVNNMEIMDMTEKYCMENGLFPYYLYRQKNMAGNLENVGYAKPGREGIYNILIMEEKQSILALGAGASTKVVASSDRIDRIENVKDIKNYMERIDEMIERKKQGFIKYGK